MKVSPGPSKGRATTQDSSGLGLHETRVRQFPACLLTFPQFAPEHQSSSFIHAVSKEVLLFAKMPHKSNYLKMSSTLWGLSVRPPRPSLSSKGQTGAAANQGGEGRRDREGQAGTAGQQGQGSAALKRMSRGGRWEGLHVWERM